MSETMNLRPFADLPEIDAIKDGDKVLVNQDGMAKQLDVSKIGGSGGGTIYAEMVFADQEEEAGVARVYADEAHSEMMTYEQAKQMFKGGAVIFFTFDGVSAILTPLAVITQDDTRAFQMVACIEEIGLFAVICADSIT